MTEKTSDSHPIELLCERYPQLTMPIEEGIRQTEEYKDVCLRGKKTVRKPEFIRNEKDTLETVLTPAGQVEALTLYEREDFEHAYKALANRCEPMDIPKSTGAVFISGLNNWDKIRALDCPLDEADKSSYKDRFVLLSGGSYSNVSGDIFGIDRDEWLEKSVIIRKYHELTHFISRSLFIQNKDAIRDEILADMTGIIAAFGKYDSRMARVFLGIENDKYREGGRLQNYVQDGTSLEDTIRQAENYINAFEENQPEGIIGDPFKLVVEFEEKKIGMT